MLAITYQKQDGEILPRIQFIKPEFIVMIDYQPAEVDLDLCENITIKLLGNINIFVKKQMVTPETWALLMHYINPIGE